MIAITTLRKNIPPLLLAGAVFVSGCAGGPLTTREKGAGIGALGGAAVGGLIGSAVGHPAAVSGWARELSSAISCRVRNSRITGRMRKFAVIRPRSIGSDTNWRGYGGSAESIRIALLI